MKFSRKAVTCAILILFAVLTLTSCKPKNYANFKVTQSKAVKGDYIILPDLTPDENDNNIVINSDKAYHFPLIMYKAIEARLPEIATKFNDFSTGISESEAEKIYSLYCDDYGAGIITDEKQKSAYYSIITDLTTKQEAKNAEATAFLKETEIVFDMFSSVLEVYLESLVSIYDYVNKYDTYTVSHEDLFTYDLSLASTVMAYWFPSVKFINSFDEKTGPYIENPWIPEWDKLIYKMNELNNLYASALLSVDRYDPDEIDELMDTMGDIYSDITDVWCDLPSIEDYESQFGDLMDKYDLIDDRACEMYDEAYDAYWDSYYNYYWW